MAVRDQLIVHYHEIGLKGRNRSSFERALVDNMRRACASIAEIKPRRLPGRILVPVPDGADGGVLAARLQRVYGIANLSRARGGVLDIDQITGVAGELMRASAYETFAVRARVAHSQFPLSAREINEKLGAWILE